MLNRLKKFLSSGPDPVSKGDESQTKPDQSAKKGAEERIASLLASGDSFLDARELYKAAGFYRHALEIDEGNIAAYTGLSRIHVQNGFYSEAEKSLRKIIALAPDVSDGYYLLGTVFQSQDRLDEAIRFLQLAIERNATLAEAYRNLAIAFWEKKQVAEAKQTVNTGISMCPDFPDLYFQLGNFYQDEKEHAKALVCYDRALAISPDNPTWHFNRGLAMQELKNNDEALACFDRAIELKPEYAEAHYAKGLVLFSRGLHKESQGCYEQALRISPAYLDAMTSLALSYMMQGQLDAALASFDEVLKIAPQHENTWGNRGNTLKALGRCQEAIWSYSKAAQFKPESFMGHYNEGICRLLIGDLPQGWQGYEWRKKSSDFVEAPRFEAQESEWLGKESLAGKTILLQAEQGLGDTIQFCRYVTHVKRLSATILLQVQPALKPLLSNLEGISGIISQKEPLPEYDYYCLLLSLPFVFGTDLASIPDNTPYIRSNAARVESWRQKLGPKTRPRVGLVWSGNPIHKSDWKRSIPLAKFARLLTDEAEFICLQNEVRPADKAVLDLHSDLLFVGEDLKSFEDTAALIELLDVVISVDTSVAHLAGAMGKRVWVLIPTDPDWRWLLDRDDSPWYRSLKLFRQNRHGDWDGVLESVADELKLLFSKLGTAPDVSSSASYAESAALRDESSIEPVIQQAAALFSSGNLVRAKELYASAIIGSPQDADAYLGLGRIAASEEKFGEAEQFIRKAINHAPLRADAHYLLGDVLKAQGDMGAAIEAYEATLALQPPIPRVFVDLCIACLQTGQRDKAKDIVRMGASIHPQFADLHFFCGNFLMEEGQAEPALDSYAQAVKLVPNIAAWHFNFGCALQMLKRYEQALFRYDRALDLQPDFLNALDNRSGTLLLLGRHDEAMATIDTLLALAPDYPNAHNNRCVAMLGLKRPDEALLSIERALQLDPDDSNALNNRGTALRELGRPEEALVNFSKAYALNPQSVDAISNCGVVLAELKRYDEALDAYSTALTLDPAHTETHFREATCRLGTGDFERGWGKYHWHEQDPYVKNFAKKFPVPIWTGKESLRGKTLLLLAEQGYGDTIQFCRYAQLAADRGARVLLDVQPPLKRLLSTVRGAAQVFARGETIPAFDFQCALLNLPHAFDTRLATVPAETPYIEADPSQIEEWRAVLGKKMRLRVGVAWSGNPANKGDRIRSAPLGQFESLFAMNADFFCLQPAVTAIDQLLLEKSGVRFVGPALNDFADTAALVSLMDVIIAVDTSVAHLAGAMNKPVWILLPFNAEWRWLDDRNDSPWYPTARLFRQPRRGDWEGVLDLAAAELHSLIHHES